MARWAMPSANWVGSEGGGVGTIRTCDASGFFIQFGAIAIPLYNVTLCIQWYLTIRHNWTDEHIWKNFERYAHAFIIPTSLILSIIPLVMKLYNQWYFYCYVTTANCNSERECNRGTKTAAYAFQIIDLAIVFVSAITITILMACIYWTVRQIVKRANAYNFSDSITTTNASNTSTTASTRTLRAGGGASASISTASTRTLILSRRQSTSRMLLTKRATMTRMVRTRAILYTIPFYITWVIPACIYLRAQLVWEGLATPLDTKWSYIGQVYVSCALPLQGFFNCCIYVYQKLQRYMKNHSNNDNNNLVCCGQLFNNNFLINISSFLLCCCKRNQEETTTTCKTSQETSSTNDKNINDADAVENGNGTKLSGDCGGSDNENFIGPTAHTIGETNHDNDNESIDC